MPNINLDVKFRSMACHDCVSQLNFMRSLYQAGVMDPECASVVSLTSEAYLAGMEHNFGNPE